jgi:hypothetical protein
VRTVRSDVEGDEVVLTERRWPVVLPLLPAFAFTGGTAVTGAVDVATGSPAGWFLLAPLFVVAVGLGWLVAAPRTVVRIGPSGVRVRAWPRREVDIAWPSVAGVRGVAVWHGGGGLVVDLPRGYWRWAGTKPLVPWGPYRHAVSVAVPGRALADTLAAVRRIAPPTVPMLPPPVRRTARVVLVVFLYTVLVGVAGASSAGTALAFRSPPDEPPRAAPADLCALIRPETLRLLVPDAGPPERRSRDGFSSRGASCDVSTERTRWSPSGTLRVTVERYGSDTRSTAAGRAGHTYARARNREFEYAASDGEHAVDLRGLGDEAAVVRGASADGDHDHADLTVRRGADLVTVDYRASPAHPGAATGAAVAVAREVLDGLR